MPTIMGLTNFFQLNLELSKEAFLEKYNHPFLIYEGDLPSEMAKKVMEDSSSDVASIQGTQRISTLFLEEENSFTVLDMEKSYLFYIQKKETGDTSPVLIGRNPSCDVIFSFQEVSGKHVSISWAGSPSKYELVDLESTNGTFLNTHPIPPKESHFLSDQDVIKMGNESFIFYSPETLFLYMSSPMW